MTTTTPAYSRSEPLQSDSGCELRHRSSLCSTELIIHFMQDLTEVPRLYPTRNNRDFWELDKQVKRLRAQQEAGFTGDCLQRAIQDKVQIIQDKSNHY
ncbi:hypothetical protein INR49_017329, partial [Caranx melampygus]